MVRHPAHLLALGFGIGLIPAAPGTFATLFAFPLFWASAPRLEATQFLLLIAVMFLAGVWACDKTGRALGVPDHGGMVWDEIVAFLLVLFFTPTSVYWQAFAFLLFRVFDILKPPPIRYYERTFKDGFGVMIDDIVAAFYTLLVVAAWKTF
ncbi:MAG: phosphatidylglycerophosphatase A [Betaproteobacteria bacterium RIFCSPLOWO2_12_FULL_62_13]|nr:MAG: phosphatidylglycerophosphatase A [Betaproteobacteria bacterium RIFCSPLOWO2_12_FULL_62_13]